MSKNHDSNNATKKITLTAPGVLNQPPEPEPEPEEPKQEVQQEPELQKEPIDFENAKEAAKYFDKQVDEWWNALDDEEKLQLKKYTGSYYVAANDALVAQGKYGTPLPQWVEDMEKGATSALSKFEVKEPIVIYRGANKACLPYFALKDPTKLIGKHYFTNAFFSAGASKDKGWSNKVKFVVTVPPCKGAGAYIGKHSTHGSEGEFLLRPHCRFLVTSASKDSSGHIELHMTLIPGNYTMISKPNK